MSALLHHVALALLTAFAAGLAIGFIRASPRTGSVALILALLVHVGLFVWAPSPPEDNATVPAEPAPVRLVRLEPPKAPVPVPEPEPVPEPMVEPEPAPTPTPAEKPTPKRAPKARPRNRAPADPPSTTSPTPAESAKPLRFDGSQLNLAPSSGVVVQAGSPGGRPGGHGGASRHANGTGTAPSPSSDTKRHARGNPWNAASAATVRSMPQPVNVPKRPCPATKDLGVSGAVALKVQVRKDGSVRRVTVTDGIGHGCDAVAASALRSARFKPAKNTAGQPVDFEIRRYVYEFRVR